MWQYEGLTVNDSIEQLCVAKGLKMTGQRRVIARVLSGAVDHPDVEMVHQRAIAIDPKISIATVYRTVRLFEEEQILERHEFGNGRARYEEVSENHHDHLIDIEYGEVIELGYRLVDHRLELFAVPLKK